MSDYSINIGAPPDPNCVIATAASVVINSTNCHRSNTQPYINLKPVSPFSNFTLTSIHCPTFLSYDDSSAHLPPTQQSCLPPKPKLRASSMRTPSVHPHQQSLSRNYKANTKSISCLQQVVLSILYSNQEPPKPARRKAVHHRAGSSRYVNVVRNMIYQGQEHC